MARPARAFAVLLALTVPAPVAVAAPKKLPVYTITQGSVPGAAASRLASALGVGVSLRSADGTLRFTNPALFGAVPMQGQGAGQLRNHTVSIACQPSCSVQPNQAVQLTANHTAVVGTPIYAWELDGDQDYDDANTKTVQQSYPAPGKYVVRVRVFGAQDPNDVAEASQTVTVAVAPPPEPKDEGAGQTQIQQFDVGALSRLTVISAAQARSRAVSALRRAGLFPRGAQVTTSNSVFGIRGPNGATVVERPLDTTASVIRRLRGIPLTGPGAEARFTFDGSGRVTQALYGLPQMRAGKSQPLLAARGVDRSARAAYKGPCGTPLRGLRLKRRLVYRTAPPSKRRKGRRVYPAYSYTASALVGGTRLPLRGVVLPAVRRKLRVAIRVRAAGANVSARARVRGGRRPYRYQWTSCTSSLDPSKGRSSRINYSAFRRNGPLTRERVVLTVTDADGFIVQRSRTVALSAVSSLVPRAGASSTSRNDVGVSWMGPQARPALRLTGPNAGGFITGMADHGVPTQYNWQGEDAFETDYEEPGEDSAYGDDVDAVFYTGHASNRNGFQTAARVGDGAVNFNDSLRWGNRDLEWLTVAACGPLGGIQTGDVSRWLPAFDGAHILMGYAVNTPDNDVEGRTYSRALFPDPGGIFGIGSRGAYSVRVAWALAAIEATAPAHIWGSMGPVGVGMETDADDHFWGQGPTGRDIPRSRQIGYWYWWGTG